MNKKQYILKLRNLKSVLDKFLGREEHDYSKGMNPRVVDEEIILPLMDLLPKQWKSCAIAIREIVDAGQYSCYFMMNTKQIT